MTHEETKLLLGADLRMSAVKQLEDALFFTALHVTDARQRGLLLDRACRDDPELRAVVEEMLAAHEDADGLIDRGYTSIASSAEEIRATPELAEGCAVDFPDERIGQHIGRYTILQNLGDGGCGSVYLAEQEDPVKRLVALKVIKLGMDTRSVIARFDAERQALAMMDHPNIARVLDAGATEAGRPYFVLELVRGTRITEFCNENRCDVRQRLRLFMQVCKAIQHAHQKGIIHRDIKPSNVLVAMHDGVPVPKVIDFGIAKAIEGRLTDETLQTHQEQMLGTPAYMSPEQAELGGLDVDTRTDVYSLGVLLYELLTDRTPFDAKELARVGPEAMRRILREREPQSPSAMLACLTTSELGEVAGERDTDAGKLLSLVGGDLDWIVMCALEKDRTRRYETVNGLAMDVLRFLNDEPISARPPGRLYLLGKLVRRNLVVFVAGVMVMLTLVSGLGVSTWLYLKARDAERRQIELRELAEGALANEIQLRDREKLTEAVRLVRRNDMEGAARVLEAIEEPPRSPSLDGVTALRAVGAWLASQGRWKESSERFSWLFEIDKLDTWGLVTLNCQALGAVLVESGDTEGFYSFCREAIDTHGASQNGDAVGRILKTCLLLPPPDYELKKKLEPLGRTMEEWYSELPREQQSAWGAIPPSLWRYRQGDFPGAIEAARLAEGYSGRSPLGPTVRAIHAMALWKLGEKDEARELFIEARDVVERKFTTPLDVRDDASDAWYDWVFARILVREASMLLGENS